MTEVAILWADAFGALLFAAWTALALREGWHALAIATAISAATGLAMAGLDPGDPGIALALTLREAMWVVVLAVLLRRHAAAHPAVTVAAASVIAAGVAALILALLQAVAARAGSAAALFAVATALRMTALAGGLLILHRAAGVAAGAGDGRAGGIALALATLWVGELVTGSVAWIAGDWTPTLLATRTAATLLAAALMGAAITHRRAMPMTLSRLLAGRLLAALALAAYLVLVAWASGQAAALAGIHARVARTAVVFGAGAALAVLVLTPWLRAWTRVMLAKHLFGHRYDYRAEWGRFTDALAGDDAMGVRIIRALAGFTDSGSGLLLLAGDGRLARDVDWNWPDAPLLHGTERFTALLATGRLVELDRGGDLATVPDALRTDPRAWAAVPLIHDGALVAAVVLARPPVDRHLDWEDFDLLRVAGRQAAGQLAEERARAALAEARRFDEFHRRFAFIMHDLKNLVSQMTLTAANARRHADKPEFRADMVATLADCADRITALIARLSSHGDQPAEPLAALDATTLARGVALRFAHHPVVVTGRAALALAHPARLEQVLAHLVQNAVEASGPGLPVTIGIMPDAGGIVIEVADRGCGMSSAFLADGLFRPFASSKPGGFGLGAFEARQLVAAMGGALTVESREGVGTRFTVRLPTAPAAEVAA